MKLTRSLLALALASCLVAPMAAAQVPSIGVVAPAMRQTYSAASTPLTPAASATDLLTISGSATKTIRVTKAYCNGSATATTGANLYLLKRSTANAGGTSTTLTAVPHDSNNSAATASVKAYTGNPATPGTAVGNLRASQMVLATATAPGVVDRLVWDLGSNFTTDQAGTLRGTAQSLAINAGGVSLPAGAALNCGFEWNEQ